MGRSTVRLYLRVACAVLTAGSLASGCAGVKSFSHPREIADHETLSAEGRGVIYALPKRQVEFSLQRKITNAADVGKQLSGAHAKLAAAAETESKAKTAETAAKAVRDNADASVKAEAEKQWRLAEAAAAAATKEKEAAAELVAAAEEAAAVADLGPACVVPTYSYSLKLLPVEPDLRYVFRAKLAHRPWRDDELTIKTTANGLLSSAKLTATDRTGDILVEIAKTISFFLGGPVTPLPEDEGKRAPCPTRLTHPPFSLKTVFDPSIFPGAVDDSKNDTYDLSGALEDDGLKTQLGAEVNRQLEALNAPFALFVDDGGKSSAKDLPLQSENLIAAREQSGEKQAEKSLPGLIYRRPLPYKIELREAVPVDGTVALAPVHSSIVFVPNEGPIGLVPYKAGAFVKTVYDVSFEEGMLTSWDANRPAELYAVWRVPLQIVDGVFEGLSKLIPLRIDQAKNEGQLLELQAKNIELDQALRELQLRYNIETDDE